jgi:hypothetical protein
MTAISFLVDINTNGLNIMNEIEDLLDGGTFSFLPLRWVRRLFLQTEHELLGRKIL